MMDRDKRVLLGMSGGTDSSVAAMLLQEAGYEVTGVTFRFYDIDGSLENIEDARLLAERLGMTHITYDVRAQFKTEIVDYFVREYMAGRTPVPCTLCNNYLKWPLLAKIADELDIFHISTGHYVQRRWVDDRYFIASGSDEEKDQSFFLWGLGQEILSRMLLPLGELSKPQVREMAAVRGFVKASVKKDSLGVCFCPMDYRSFLAKEVDASAIVLGKFLDEEGRVLGEHAGYPFYTIGQRRGLGIHLNRPVFVKEIRPETNEVVLGSLQSLERMEMYLKDWNIVDESKLLNQEGIIVKIRYRKQLNHGVVKITADNLLRVVFSEPLTAIAAGQAAAFYKGDMVLGGGIIV